MKGENWFWEFRQVVLAYLGVLGGISGSTVAYI